MKTREFENQDVKDITEFLEWMDSAEPLAYGMALIVLIIIAGISVFFLSHFGLY